MTAYDLVPRCATCGWPLARQLIFQSLRSFGTGDVLLCTNDRCPKSVPDRLGESS